MSAYARPTDIADALALRALGHRILAGGTDVYPAAGPQLTGDVLDISGISDLRGITLSNDLRIGAATTWSAIAEADLPPALFALQQAALVVGGRQIQNAGTIGGNICNASPAADGIPPLLVLSAEVELASVHVRRRLALSDYLLGARRVDMGADEIMVALHIPQAALKGQSHFAKLGARSHLVISIAMVAVRIVTDAGRITESHIAIGSCSATAQRMPLVEAALNGTLTADAPKIVAAEHLAALTPIDDIRATGAYRMEAVLELLRRSLAAVAT